MTWPTTWASLREYTLKAPCGCRYKYSCGKGCIKVSPNRAQRCFAHMKTNAYELAGIIKASL